MQKDASELTRTNQPTLEWPLWKILGLAILGLGGPAVVMSFFPTYSPLALAVGGILTLLGTLAAISRNLRQSWVGKALFANAWLIPFLVSGVRGLSFATGITLPWIILLPSAYLLAWLLPILRPRISAILFREQFAPETRVGQAILSFSFRILPVAGVLGASAGLYGPRYGGENLVILVASLLAAIVAVAGVQAISHQILLPNPWAKIDPPVEGEI
jgi:hypothetical protein